MNNPWQNCRKFAELYSAVIDDLNVEYFEEMKQFRKLMPELHLPDDQLFSVAALVFNHKGQVLSVSRRNQPTNIGLPGGKIDPGELPFQAMCRELHEETGLKAVKYCPVYERGEDTAGGRPSRTFFVSVWEGKPKSMEPGLSVEWVEPRDLLAECCSFRVYNENLFTALTF